MCKLSAITSRIMLIVMIIGMLFASQVTTATAQGNLTVKSVANTASNSAAKTEQCIPQYRPKVARIAAKATKFKAGQPAKLLPASIRDHAPRSGKYAAAVKITDPGADVYAVEAGKIKYAFKSRTGDRPAAVRNLPRIDCGGETYVNTPRQPFFTVGVKEKDHPLSYAPEKSMRYSAFFNGGIAFHASDDFRDYEYGGYRHSGGCVNLRPNDAIALYNWLNVGDRVIVVDGYN